MADLSNLTSLVGYNIPENSAATPGLWNAPYAEIDRNFATLNAAAGLIAVGGSGVSRYVNVAASPYLATGLGLVSEHTRFAAAVTDVNTNGGLLFIPPGTYKFTSVATLSCPSLPLSGVTLWASGITLPITGEVLAGSYSFLSGAASLSGNSHIRGAIPQWFGVTSDRSTDDGPAWQRAVNAVADGTPFLIPIGTKSMIRTTITLSNRQALQFLASRPTLDGNAPSDVEMIWDGELGGRIFNLDRAKDCYFHGIQFRTLDLGAKKGPAAQITSGSSLLIDLSRDGGQFTSSDVGKRGVLWRCGTEGDPFTFRIASVRSLTHATMDVSASTTTSYADWIIGSLNGLPGKSAVDCDGEPTDGHLHGVSATIASGSSRVTLDIEALYPDLCGGVGVGRTFLLDGAGPGGSVLTTRLAVYATDMVAYLADSASSTVASGGSYTIMGNGVSGGYGSENGFEYCQFHSPSRYSMLEFLRISKLADSNHEFYTVQDCLFSGGDMARQPAIAVSASAGTSTITSAGLFDTRHIGQPVKGSSCGPGGGRFTGYLKDVISANTAILNVSASSDATNARLIVGEGQGVGLVIGGSANALGHVLKHNTYQLLKWGVHSGGHYTARDFNNFTHCEVGFYLDGISRPIKHENDIGENNGRAIQIAGGVAPFHSVAGNYDTNQVDPHGSLFNWDGMSATVTMDDAEIEGSPPDDITIHAGYSAAVTLLNTATRLEVARTMAQIGYDYAFLKLRSKNEKTITDAPGAVFNLGLGGDGGGMVITAAGTTLLPNASNLIVLCDATLGAQTALLPQVFGPYYAEFLLKKIDSSANTVTVLPNGVHFIDGAASYDLTAQYQGIRIAVYNQDWYIMGTV